MRGRQDVLDTFRGDLARTLLPPGQPFPDMTAAVVSEAAAAAAAPPPSQLGGGGQPGRDPDAAPLVGAPTWGQCIVPLLSFKP